MHLLAMVQKMKRETLKDMRAKFDAIISEIQIAAGDVEACAGGT